MNANTNTKTNKSDKPAKTGSFAVIKTGGKQYKVRVGDTLNIEKIKGEHQVGEKLDFNEVLLTDDGSSTTIGAPFIKDAKVKAEIIEFGRAKKVVGMRYKQKSRSRSTKFGHRQPFFKVKIETV